jgi:hypothetical protein
VDYRTDLPAVGAAVELRPTPEGLTEIVLPDGAPPDTVEIRLPRHWSEHAGAALGLAALAGMPLAWYRRRRRARPPARSSP